MVKKRLPKYLHHEQVIQIFSKIPVPEDQYRLAFELMYECCMRVSEVTSLKVRDVNLQESVISIQNAKGGDRTVPMSPYIASRLEKHIQGKPMNAFVFTKKSGKPFTRQHLDFKLKLYTAWAGLTDSLGFTMSCHKLRHSGAREYIRRGILDIEDVRKILGHRHLSTTTIYLETLPIETKNKILRSGGLCKNA